MNRYRIWLVPGHFPLWRAEESGQFTEVSPRELPISDDVANAIFLWAGRFDEAMAWPEPRNRGFTSDKAFDKYVREGEELARVLSFELGVDSVVEPSIYTRRYVRVVSPKVKRFRIFPYWGLESPVWNGVPGSGPYNLSLEHLPISDGLANDFRLWNERFQSTLNPDDPVNSGFSTIEESRDFCREGEQLAERFNAEIGSQSEVSLEYREAVYVRRSEQ